MVRVKSRHLIVQLDFGTGERAPAVDFVSDADLFFAIKASAETNFGVAGVANVLRSLQVVHLCPVTQLAVIRCARSALEELWASLALVTSLKKTAVALRVLDVLGSKRTVAAAAMRWAERAVAVHGESSALAEPALEALAEAVGAPRTRRKSERRDGDEKAVAGGDAESRGKRAR